MMDAETLPVAIEEPVKEEEAPPPLPLLPPPDPMPIFEDWLKQNNGTFSKIKFIDFEKEGRGAVAVESFKSNEMLCSVPISLLIYKTPVMNSQMMSTIGPFIEDGIVTPNPDDNWWVFYVFLLYEKYVVGTIENNGSLVASHWKPYLDILPEYVGTPMGFDDAIMGELYGTNLYEVIISI